LKSFLCIYKQKELYINNLIEMNFNLVYTINIITYSPLPREGRKKIVCGPAFGASLFKLWGLVFFYLFRGFAFRGLGLFGTPCPEKEQKKIVCGPVFGASLFKLWGLVFFNLGASLLGALDSLGPRAVWILL
jgi:hypothetical protein